MRPDPSLSSLPQHRRPSPPLRHPSSGGGEAASREKLMPPLLSFSHIYINHAQRLLCANECDYQRVINEGLFNKLRRCICQSWKRGGGERQERREGRRREERIDRMKGRLWERVERGGGGAGVTDFFTACQVAIREHRERVSKKISTHAALSDACMPAISFLSKSEEKENQGRFLNPLTASLQTHISPPSSVHAFH